MLLLMAVPRRHRPVMISTARICSSCGVAWLADGTAPQAYCSLACSSAAKAVRYARQKRAEWHGRQMPEDIKYAVRIKIAHALNGGYDEDARRLAPETRRAVRERDRDRCVLCEGTGTEIDHIDGPDSSLSNLRLLCSACHRTITEAHLHPVTDDSDLDLWNQLMTRISSEEPTRSCDEPNWNWRAWCATHGLADPETAALLDDDDMEARGDGDDSGYGPDSYWAHSLAKDD